MAESVTDRNRIEEKVRETYAAAARSASAEAGASCGPSGCGCGPGDTTLSGEQREAFGASLYGEDERGALPDAARLASLGCGNPTAVAELHEGETVLDLGSGGGIDVLLPPAASARPARPMGST